MLRWKIKRKVFEHFVLTVKISIFRKSIKNVKNNEILRMMIFSHTFYIPLHLLLFLEFIIRILHHLLELKKGF